MDQVVLAAATGSTGGLGKITTEPAAGVLYVRFDCAPNTYAVEWCVQCNKKHQVQGYRAASIVQSYTLTLSSLADGETIVVAGLTFTAEDTEAQALAASRKFYTGGADDTADATALAALLNNATYGVPGVTATSALGVVTLVPTTAPVIQAATGTAAGHCVVAHTTLASLIAEGSKLGTDVADNSTTAGTFYRQVTYGWPYAYLAVTNSDGADPATIVVKATGYAE